jgi:hypothetical protein
MDGWSVALLAVAALVAITTLVRLMIQRRDALLGDFRRRMKAANRVQREKRRTHAPPDETKDAA